MKLPPPRIIFVVAYAFNMASEPLAITMPGDEELPSTRLRLFPP